MDEKLLQEVQEILNAIGQIKPGGVSSYGKHFAGEGFVTESLFIVQRHRIFWVVLLGIGTFAFKEVSAEWVEMFDDLVTNSPWIFVKFDRHHRIKEWVVIQPKEVPAE